MNLQDLEWMNYGKTYGHRVFNDEWSQARFGKSVIYFNHQTRLYRVFASWGQGGDPRIWHDLEPIEAQCVVNYLVDVHP